MCRAELTWRTRAVARIAADRMQSRVRKPRWNRADLADALSEARLKPGATDDGSVRLQPDVDAIRTYLRTGRFDDALADCLRDVHAEALLAGANAPTVR